MPESSLPLSYRQSGAAGRPAVQEQVAVPDNIKVRNSCLLNILLRCVCLSIILPTGAPKVKGSCLTQDTLRSGIGIGKEQSRSGKLGRNRIVRPGVSTCGWGHQQDLRRVSVGPTPGLGGSCPWRLAGEAGPAARRGPQSPGGGAGQLGAVGHQGASFSHVGPSPTPGTDELHYRILYRYR